MKPTFALGKLGRATALCALLLAPTLVNAQSGWKLIGITGMQQSTNIAAYPDHTLFDLDTFFTDPGFGYANPMFRVTWVHDTQSIGYCPTNGLLYHTGGSESYSNNPLRRGFDQNSPDVFGVGYQDSQYMESIDLQTHTYHAIFNADPCPNPDPTLPCFGLPAPRPSWVLPVERRDHTQTGGEYRARGTNEYDAIRGMAWSSAKNAFYCTDDLGIFKVTPEGDSQFVARPAFPNDQSVEDSKGILVIPETLLIGHRNAGEIMEVEAESGRVLQNLELKYPAGGGDPLDSFGGVLGLAQHPDTKTIYAIRKTDDAFHRELCTVDIYTGDTTLLGDMQVHIAGIAFVPSGNTNSPWRLVGITGMQQNTNAAAYPDHTLFDLDTFITDPGFGYANRMFTVTWVHDTQSIGYCPVDGLLYHTGGSESYSNNPQRRGYDQNSPDVFGVGYQDSQYMETINLSNQTFHAVFNADPCPNPDPTLPCFGLPAPRPSWVLPTERRNSTQTGGEYRARGTNEYDAVRDMAWSAAKNAFYVSDNEGIFKITRDGDCKFISRPAFPSDHSVEDSKGILVVPERLLIGHRNAGFVMEVDAETGAVRRNIELKYPPRGGDPTDSFGGVLGLAQHPDTGVIYALRKTDDNFDREIVSIDPLTGDTTFVGDTQLHLASIAFVGIAPLKIVSAVRNGSNLQITWVGGRAPYQLQARSDLATGSWTDVGSSTSDLSATVQNVTTGKQFFRVVGQ